MDTGTGDTGENAGAGASFLILTQVFTKLASFAMNQMLIRFISPEVFGLATYLEFLVSTVLFFSREAERLAIQRTRPESRLQTITNFGFVPLAIGVPATAALVWTQYKTETFQKVILGRLWFILALILLELLAEPAYAINQYQLNFKRRSKIEGMAVSIRCAVTFAIVMVVRKSPDFEASALTAFALGQFAYSFTIALCYLVTFDTRSSTYLVVNQDSYFDSEVVKFWKSVSVQMVFKHLLTEGDRIVVNVLCTTSEQGVYAVVSNYGSMIARLLFQPIEESLRLTFTKKLSSTTKENVFQTLSIMHRLFLFYANLSVLICLAGYTNGSFLLKILLGKRLSWALSNIFEVFPQYLVHIPFLAFNGILEAFFSSVATDQQVKTYSYFMTALSLIVIGLLYALIARLEMGISGLICANVVNMVLRIVYCSKQLKAFYISHGVKRHQTLAKAIPALSIGAVGAAVQRQVLGKWHSETLTDIVKSAFVCAVCLVAMAAKERHLLKDAYVSIKKKRE